jgi:cobalt-zinc-cadmium resistance protein CzcA
MLFAGNLMLQAGVAASLLSLGAVDFGIIVDGAVVRVENAMRRLAERQRALGRPLSDDERREVLAAAPLEVARPVAFGVGIILIVFLPILTLEGIEGKMFRPMALTMIFALAGSLVLSLTLVPALASIWLPRHVTEREPWLVRVFHRLYEPVLNRVLRRRALTLSAALALVAGAGFLAARMGGEFLPKLGEQALAVSTVRLAGVALDEAVALNSRIERELLDRFPDEIRHIWSRLGTAEVATDPMGIELTDFFIALTPRNEWTQARTQRDLVEAMRKIFNKAPGMTAAFSQPIEMRMNEMIAGVRGDVAVKVYGDDLDVLGELSGTIQGVLSGIRGASEVAGEQISGQPVLEVRIRPDARARFGVSARDVLGLVETVGTPQVGEVREGQRRFPLVVRLPDRQRTDPVALAGTLIPTATGAVLPLDRVATISLVEGPSTINREWGRRRTVIQCNVHGRDVAGFVAEARRELAANIRLPDGYVIEWGGQFENMERANRRLMFVVPVALALIFVLLYFGLRNLRDVFIVATGIPLGAVGGVVALWLRGMPFTVSAGIGFIALSGVAILNGLVLVTFVQQRLAGGAPLESAVREGCLVRLRPVLMTALVAAVGFIPMAFNVGVGGEVQRPLATVVIGGIITNTLLTLLVLPALYMSLARGAKRP